MLASFLIQRLNVTPGKQDFPNLICGNLNF